jgi:hypothetical protein
MSSLLPTLCFQHQFILQRESLFERVNILHNIANAHHPATVDAIQFAVDFFVVGHLVFLCLCCVSYVHIISAFPLLVNYRISEISDFSEKFCYSKCRAIHVRANRVPERKALWRNDLRQFCRFFCVKSLRRNELRRYLSGNV